ncbi:DUF2975 domain-containing protein [Orbus sturtevantii]|uniref:hypothetical protein n=1 Tax=Orbus sturtevantii TaxID=3074109 RepID=UPI00370DD16C
MNTRTRLNRYSYFMASLTLIPLICVIVACLSPLLFYFFNTTNIGLESDGYSLFIETVVNVAPTTLKIWQATLATILDTLPIIGLAYAFYQLRQLFICYSNADYFSLQAAKHCYYFGLSLTLWVVLGMLFEPLQSIILSYNLTEGRYISVSLTSEDILTLFPAISIMLIGQILKKATELAEENKQFV